MIKYTITAMAILAAGMAQASTTGNSDVNACSQLGGKTVFLMNSDGTKNVNLGVVHDENKEEGISFLGRLNGLDNQRHQYFFDLKDKEQYELMKIAVTDKDKNVRVSVCYDPSTFTAYSVTYNPQ
ncbi:hypothetical protein [Photobacterium damselae]|uniref:hypothetical protein n=1 Tax=Photobacterium damselae TaxID=38293 RepID=UPI004067BDCA